MKYGRNYVVSNHWWEILLDMRYPTNNDNGYQNTSTNWVGVNACVKLNIDKIFVVIHQLWDVQLYVRECVDGENSN